MIHKPLNPNVAIGKVVRKRREELGLTSRAFAAQAGVDHTLLSRLEDGGDITLSKFMKLYYTYSLQLPPKKPQ